jgi:hypothetical protein
MEFRWGSLLFQGTVIADLYQFPYNEVQEEDTRTVWIRSIWFSYSDKVCSTSIGGDTMSEQSPSGSAEKSALSSAANFVKFVVALATASLVVSAALITDQIDLSTLGIVLLILSWLALALSVLAGVIAYSKIPIKFANKDYDLLGDRRLRSALATTGVMFVAGIVCLSLGLSSALFSSSGTQPTPTPTFTLTVTTSPSPASSETPTFTVTPSPTEGTPDTSPTP